MLLPDSEAVKIYEMFKPYIQLFGAGGLLFSIVWFFRSVKNKIDNMHDILALSERNHWSTIEKNTGETVRLLEIIATRDCPFGRNPPLEK